MAITLPGDPAAPVAMALDGGNGQQPSRIETFRVSAAGGEALGAPPVQPRRLVRFLHTGEVFGQTVAGLASIAAAALAYTGLALGLRRLARLARTRRVAG